ncbi:MAG TPA: cytochrome c peroxidase [Kofleriaceae bacterium]|nr:cytochrome c peroxidase [Kofleriaceae bacterium]
MISTRTCILGVVLGLSLGACGKKKANEGGGDNAVAPPPTTPTPTPPAASRPSQGPLQQMPALTLPADPARDAKVELGHNLFFDPRMSGDGKLACYSCHKNEDGTGGHDPIAMGDGGKLQKRHAPQLWNLGYHKSGFYWDGRAAQLEDVAKGAWAGGNMGVGADNLEKKAGEMAKIPGYAKLWKAAYGDAAPTAAQAEEAIADYLRTITCTDTAYDKFAGGDKSALTDQQQRGLDVFLGKGTCSACHTPPYFTIAAMMDGGAFFNAGVGTAGKAEADVDPGRGGITNNPADWAAFKVPTLRGVVKSPPYFHDGSKATLPEAVRYMGNGAQPNKNLTSLLNSRNLTDDEINDVVAFLGGLECKTMLVEPKLP